jgi:hypothetical protein
MNQIEQKILADGTLSVKIKGAIGEDFDGAPIRREATGARILMHLGEVHSLSSLGVFALTRLIDSLKPREIVFLHVSSAIARQLTILPGLFDAVRVESARLPFICPACGEETVTSIPFSPGADLAHAPTCACGARMELDGLAEQYLPS